MKSFIFSLIMAAIAIASPFLDSNENKEAVTNAFFVYPANSNYGFATDLVIRPEQTEVSDRFQKKRLPNAIHKKVAAVLFQYCSHDEWDFRDYQDSGRIVCRYLTESRRFINLITDLAALGELEMFYSGTNEATIFRVKNMT